MKTKIKKYSFASLLLFCGIFFASLNNFTNISLAADSVSDYSYTQEMCDQYYGTGYAPNADGTGCESLSQYSYTQEMCDQYYGTGYAPNASGTGCDPASVDSPDSIDESYGQSGLGGTSTLPVGCEEGFVSVGGVCFPGQDINGGLSEASITDILMNVFGWIFGIFFTLAIAAFIISGIQYFLSAGDESMAESAKKNAVNAIIGIIVGLSGFIIVRAIGTALSGTSSIF